jgi:hypothetical protein
MPRQETAFFQKLHIRSHATQFHWLIVVDICKHLTKIAGVVLAPTPEASTAEPEIAAWFVLVAHFIVARNTFVVGQTAADSAIGEFIKDVTIENGVESFHLLLVCMALIADL